MAVIYENQHAALIDLVAAGEIGGLVNGYASIFFNGVALLDETKATATAKSGTATVSGTSVTNANGLFLNIDLSQGDRYLQIVGAGPSDTTTSQRLKVGTRNISTGSGIFASKHELNPTNGNHAILPSTAKYTIRIAGAGRSGGEYRGIVQTVNSSTNATIFPPIYTAVNPGATVSIDEVQKISSITNGNTATLSSAVETNVTSARVRLSSVVVPNIYNVQNTGLNLAYDNLTANFSRGTREGDAEARSVGGSQTANFIIPSGQQLKLVSGVTTGQGSNGSQSPAAGALTSSSLNLPQNSAEEIDRVRVNIKFPGGLRHVSVKGDDNPAYAEFQVVVKYKVTPSDPEKAVLIHGKDYGGSNFLSNVPNWTKAAAGGKAQNNYRAIAIASYSYGTGPRIVGGNTGIIRKRGNNPAFVATFEVDLKQFQPFSSWAVEVRRLSPESELAYAGDESFVGNAVIDSFDCIIEDKFSYPTSALAYVSYSAEDFQNVPQRAYHIYGKKIKVPTNYITREESNTGVAKYTRNLSGVDTGSYVSWTGSFRGDKTLSPSNVNFREVYCNNPAWIFYDILTNKEYGLGEFLEESDIDKFALFRIARYCDELVPDGKGGLEPRFTCNVYISQIEESYKVLKDLASTFRGMLGWIDGLITPIQDSPKEALYTFTQGNVEEGIFSYTYTGQRARVNQVNVTWNNPDEFYKKTVLSVEDTGNIVKQGKVVPKDIVAFGCTSESQARRLADWHIATDTKETEIVSFTTGINASYLRPGDIINVQDKEAYSLESSGRVGFGSSTNSIVLDRTVDFGPGGTVGTDCKLVIIFPGGGVYLAQDTPATIGSGSAPTYTRGAFLPEARDASGNLLDLVNNPPTSAASINYFDNSGNHIDVQFSTSSRIETKDITNTGTAASTITVNGAFSQAPLQDYIWAVISDDETADNVKKFRIASITEDDGGKYDLTATQYEETKFDEIDTAVPTYTTGYVPDTAANRPVPPPTGLTLQMVPSASSSVEGQPISFDTIITWTPPVETIVDSAGNTRTVNYRFTERYEIAHDLTGTGTARENTTIAIAEKGSTNFTVNNVSEGDYLVKIRTVNTLGAKSPWEIVSTSIAGKLPSEGSNLGVARGGKLDAPFTFNTSTGLFTINARNYTFTPPFSSRVAFLSASSAQRIQVFSTISTSDEVFLYFDRSAAASDPWKGVVEHTDSTVEDIDGNTINFTYLKEFGAANNGLSTTSGTVSTTFGSNIVHGTSTNFSSELVVGQLIKISANSSAGTEVATAEYRVVSSITSNTKLLTTTPFTRTTSGVSLHTTSLVPDTGEDCIFGVVTKSGTVFNLELFGVTTQSRGGYSAVLDNESHVFQANAEGVVSSVAGADFGIRVFNSDVRYYFDSSASPADNTYSLGTIVQSPSNALTFSTTTTGSSPAVDAFIDITAMSSTVDAGTLTIPIIINNGGPTFERTFSFSKSKAGSNGSPGSDGLRTIQGYLFYEKTTAGAPAAPSGNTYTFSTGVVTGSGINDSGTTNVWRNSPRTQDATSDNFFWTVRYYGQESSAGSSTITVAYTNVVQQTSFTGVVVFSGGTLTDGSTSKTPLEASDIGSSGSTTIDGGRITTGVINLGNSSGMAIRQGKTAFGQNTAGFFIGNDGGTAKLDIGTNASHIRWNGSSLSVAGNIAITGTQISSALGYTPTDDTAADAAQSTANTATSNAATAQSTANTANSNAATAQSTANTANNRAQNFDTSGDIFQGISVGTGGHVRGGQSAFNNGVGFFLGYSGSAYKFSIGNSNGQRLTWNGSTLSINGDITITGTQINNALGYTPTDDTAAAAAQSTANTANSNAAAAQSTANTANSNAGAAQSTANTANSNAAAAQATANSKLSSSDVTQSFIEGKITNAASFRADIAAYASSNPSGFTTFAAGDVQNAIVNNVTSISGSKITTGTIDAANVSVINLSASNISTGTLNAARINLGTTTFETDSAGRLVIKSGGVVTDSIGANAITNVTTDTSDNQGGTGNSSYFLYRDVGLSISVAKISGSDLLISGSFEIIPYNDQTMFRYRLLKGSTVIKTWGDNTGIFSSTAHGFGMPFGSPVQVAFDHIESSSGSGTNTYKIQCAVRDEEFDVYNATIYALELKR